MNPFRIVKGKKAAAAYVAAVLCMASVGVFAATEHWNDASLTPKVTTKTAVADATDWQQWKSQWDTIKTNYEHVSIAPGADASQLNFGWYSKDKADKAVVRVADNQAMKQAKTFDGICQEGTVISGVTYYTNKVTVQGLKPSQTYWYQVKLNGKWQDAQQVKTGNPDDFTFMYVGDPQIGASAGQVPSDGTEKQNGDIAARNDSYNWNKTLNTALAQHPEINFLVSPGDQINEPATNQNADKIQLQEYQYAGYLSAAALRSLPEATTIGNHDSMTAAYQNHFNVPNPFTEETNPTKAGHGYYYTYGNALFIVINANNYNAADHQALIEKAVKAHPDTKWRIVVMHQDIYGSGLDHSDSDGILLRTQLTPIYDANKIDVVLQGHDHTYARTYQLSSDGKDHATFDDMKVKGQSGQAHNLLSAALKNQEFKNNYESQNLCYTIADMKQGVLRNPKGVFYMSANSATGSKFYNLIPQQQDYVAARSQTWRPTYSVIRITKDTFTINTYDVETGTPIDSSYSIVKD
ncbi:metallophosphoesterase family protein [uncultured Megasphaera sp.]|uniref:purple acid phosphatase family protein n=1 Tax=uncultured Megasphaera sp. TaxID=165188 RepID=UPI002659775A|nr:metallophosphoesterase family protein [uncultured Megasphaera sp.]